MDTINLSTKIRDYYLTEEPNFVTGERVKCIKGENDGREGVVFLHHVGTLFGVKFNCDVLAVRWSASEFSFGPGTMDRIVSIDSRYTK